MAEPCASRPWSGLAIDLLIHIVHLLELPEALAFRGVCPLWRSASTAAAGVPRTRQTPWLVSLVVDPLSREKQSCRALDPSVSSKFTRDKAVALCGASHGWLVAANELSNLVLYDPIATTTIPLPPITGFTKCIVGVYGDDGSLEGYRYLFRHRDDDSIHDVVSPGSYFYDKVVLSGPPSADGAIALAVHTDGKRLSSARVGGSFWRQLSTIDRVDDSFADIVHYCGRFYSLTMKGILVSWDFYKRHRVKREMNISKDDDNLSVITRYLVSTPWGQLLQVRVLLDKDQKNGVRVEIDRLDLKSHRMVVLKHTEALQGHAVFLGQNSPRVLSTGEFPELKPDCIYFTTPRLKNDRTYGSRYNRWNGVKVYDLKKQMVEPIPWRGEKGENYGSIQALKVWFTPSELPY